MVAAQGVGSTFWAAARSVIDRAIRTSRAVTPPASWLVNRTPTEG